MEDGALDDLDREIADLGDPEDPDERLDLADLLGRRAELLADAGRLDAAAAACRDLIERFGDDEDAVVADLVEWAGQMVAHAWHDRGQRLHRRIGRAAEAEAAYRRAIIGGSETAWLDLGLLLGTVRGRERDEENALLAALDVEDPETAAAAALALANLRDRRGRDDDVRELYELAAQRGDERAQLQATLDLAMLDALAGDREPARRAILACVEHYARRFDLGPLDRTDERLAALLSSIAAGRLTRRAFRRFRRACHGTGRRRRRLRQSPPARLCGRVMERRRPLA